MTVAPIAIVGRACVLPGALDPDALWQAVAAGRDLLGETPADRWRVDPEDILCTPDGDSTDKTWSTRGGYVSGFESVWDPTGFGVEPAALDGLDPLFLWTLHVAREALRDAGDRRDGVVDRPRVAAVFGNLGFPTSGMSQLAEAAWFGDAIPDTRNRFMNSGPARLLEEALGLQAGVFCLDAACASSLYAIKLGCDRLRDGAADVVLAGAVNRADDLFIHVGFSALGALSRSGQSRPFHADADGLVPGEGAAFVALKRLDDARRDGDQVLGVIRGIGLSNDGRARGFLAPSAEGQVRAMRAAWDEAGLDPRQAQLLECHATGTTVGDATELQSAAEVFVGTKDLPIGSLKSNLGHLITAAGVAGLIKVLEAMRHGVRPPTLHADQPNAALADGPFRLLRAAEPWAAGPRLAAVSAFGFGGNNAHLVVGDDVNLPTPSATQTPVPLAVIGLGARVGAGESAADLAAVASVGGSQRAVRVVLDLAGLRVPPRGLSQTLPQQLSILAAAREAADDLNLPERTGVFVGMETDPAVCRYGARWRLRSRLRDAGVGEDDADAWVARHRDSLVGELESAGVVGTMPNIVANRINTTLNLRGGSFVVSAGEASGRSALELGRRALHTGELDAVLVGAVDLSHDPLHRASLAVADGDVPPGDASIVLVLKRLTDAEAAGDDVLAVLCDDDAPAVDRADLNRRFGRCWAAGDLRDLAVALLQSRERGAAVSLPAGGGFPGVTVRPGPAPLPLPKAPRRPLVFAAHADAVRLPALPSSQEPQMQTMAPAPTLTPMMTEPGTTAPMAAAPAAYLPVPSAVRAAAPIAAAPAVYMPAPSAAPAAPLAAAPTASDDVLATLRRQIALLGATHTAHLEQQRTLHERFLALRSRSMDRFFGHAAGTDLAGPPLTVARSAPSAPSAAAVPSIRHVVSTRPATPVAPPTAPARPHAPSPPALRSPQNAPASPPRPASAPAPTATTATTAAATPSATSTAAPATAPRPPIGPTFDRAQLAIHASGRVSDVFGPAFIPQDSHPRQVRMPEPPLLLADRVTGVDAEPMSMTTGTIWTETDVCHDSWYLHHGRMPAGVLIESGQADLMLISWLGIDAINKGERIYRLLGCEITWHGDLPKVGDTLAHDIHLDGHAKQGDVRLMFFHSDCHVDGELRMSVRQGQAGFFTDAELADSDGCLWVPETQELAPHPRLDPPDVECHKHSLTGDDLRAFAAGRPWDCFGEDYGFARTHTRTPTIQSGDMLFLDEVEVLSSRGGPWGRGYLRGRAAVTADHWFLDGHFKNDPCMPGTLMFEGCLQAMAIHMASLGFTVKRDGWRFQPVQGEAFKLSCRGQVTPSAREITYEVFVEEVHSGPVPTLYADVLCTVDGLKAFHARRVGLQLVPDWPMDDRMSELVDHVPSGPCAVVDGFPFDHRSMLACAWGRPSEAFGPIYTPFDGPRRPARLPGPPYLFMSRVVEVNGPIGVMAEGCSVEVAYDVPPDAWYFKESGHPVMPFAVLLEAALQPCGWLASYIGCALSVDKELMFRNLDGSSEILSEVTPADGILTTRVLSTTISKAAGMILVGFEVECDVGDRPVLRMKTVFGFFPKEALENQVGLPTTPEERVAYTAEPTPTVDLTAPTALARTPALAGRGLLMLDRVVRFDPVGGEKGLGTARAEKDVHLDEWFFKAHFFQDPVQPGSLGIEAMLQLLQWTMRELGMADGVPGARFEPIANDHVLTWRYRGQVLPGDGVISSTVEIVERGVDAAGPYAVAEASLWIDGKRIYDATGLAMRIVPGDDPSTTVLDPDVDTWVGDHRPTWTVPALPMMSVADLLAQGIDGTVVGLRDVKLSSWLTVERTRRVSTSTDGDSVRLIDAEDGSELASARVLTGAYAASPAPMSPVEGAEAPSPYHTGTLFHGPAFQLLTRLVQVPGAASSVLRAASTVPLGRLNPALLDAATHGIPHDQLHGWDRRIAADKVAYPARLVSLDLFGPPPAEGEVRCEVRLDTTNPVADLPAFDVQLIVGDVVWAQLRLVEACFPKGTLGMADPADRRAFLRDRAFVPGLRLSGDDGSLSQATVNASDWLPGTMQAVYGTRDATEIAVKEQQAAVHRLHPGLLPDALPLTRFDAGDPTGTLDLTPVRAFWDVWFNRGPWPVEDLYYGLIQRFVGRVVLTDPVAFAAVKGQSLLFAGNHQVGLESLLFSMIGSALGGVPAVTIAKAEHRHTWLGDLIAHCFSYPGVADPRLITFFDRQDKSALHGILGELKTEMEGPGRSVMVHVEGTRSLSCAEPVKKMSGIFLDLALDVGAPVIPIRFVGALPVEPLHERIEFPVGMGRQDIWIGRPIMPEDLAAMPYGERKKTVIAAMNALGPPAADERPLTGDPALAARAAAWQTRHGVSHPHAVLGAVLSELDAPGDEVRRMLASGDPEALAADGTAESLWLAELARRLWG